MRYNVLGRTGLEVSRIGIGGIGTMGKYGSISREEFAATMEQASELRVNFLDTAPAYGDSEAVFGHYLKDHGQSARRSANAGTRSRPDSCSISASRVSDAFA
jgi:aryl-alcohol dehydrogenase-like predicted oxidoreductase